MSLRFSLKWLLLGMVYVAVAAAAFGQPKWVFSDAIWFTGWAALGYAVLLACFARGGRRARGFGFALFAVAYLAAAYFSPESVPVTRILNSLGIRDPLKVDDDPNAMLPAAPLPLSRGTSSPYVTFSARGDAMWMAKLRAAHGLAIMTLGLLGSLAATLAAGPDRSASPAAQKTMKSVAAPKAAANEKAGA